MRLNKFLAHAGVCSRRDADTLIESGRVSVNGERTTKLGTTINPDTDKVKVDGKIVALKDHTVIYLLNKPRGVVTTTDDPEGKKTVLDFVPTEPRVFPCGRLDEETMGLVVLTNDGNLCYQLTHPKFEHQKEYVVEGISKSPTAAIEILKQKVIQLKDGPATIDDLQIVKTGKKDLKFHITIHEGRNRLVRRICAKAGVEVVHLTRIRLGKFELGDLAPGKFTTHDSGN